MQSKRKQREAHEVSRLSPQRIHTRQSDLSTVVGRPTVGSKPKKSTADSSTEQAASQKASGSKAASPAVTSRKSPKGTAEKVQGPEFVKEHVMALKQAINNIATGGEHPLDLARFDPATEVSEAVVSAVMHAAKFGQTWGFTAAQTETFVGQLKYRLEDLLEDYIAENNPRLELVRALIKGLEPTLNAWDESIREDLLNA